MDFKELLLPILKSLLSRIDFSNPSSVKRALQIAANVVDSAGQDEVAAILRSDELANVVESHYRLYAFIRSQYGANTVQAIDWQPLLQMLLPILMDLIRKRLGAKQVAAEAACDECPGGNYCDGIDCEREYEELSESSHAKQDALEDLASAAARAARLL